MEKFYYSTQKKVITWVRDDFFIISNTKEEADKKMKELFDEHELGTFNWNDSDKELEPCWCEREWDAEDNYYDTVQAIDGATYELYDSDGEVVCDNKPLHIVRDNKIDFILG